MSIGKPERRGGYQPPKLVDTAPLFAWPPQPLGLLKWLFGFPGYLWPWTALYAAISLVTWVFLTPNLSTMKSFSVGWVAYIFCRNVALIALFTGAWHFRLYVQRAQGTDYKYNSRWLSTDNPRFLFRNQLWDNVFWTFVSAVPIWTAYEILTLWMQANGFVPLVGWRAHPVYCLLLMLFIPVFQETHFYVIHRLIHWPPLYRAVHSLHHENVNPGPWSGVAMHPVEHVLYFSGVLLHWILPSHPLHVLFHLQYTALSPTQGHCGFHKIELPGKIAIRTEQYAHYLHHKYFEVNYGGDIVPFDKLFGTFHDGSDEAQEALNRRMRMRNRAPRN